MNAIGVLAAVGTGPPGQPPSDGSPPAADGQPFASLMALALEELPTTEGVPGVAVPVATTELANPTATAVEVTPQPLLPGTGEIDGTSVGLDRPAEVSEDDASSEAVTAGAVAVALGLVPQPPPETVTPTAQPRAVAPADGVTADLAPLQAAGGDAVPSVDDAPRALEVGTDAFEVATSNIEPTSPDNLEGPEASSDAGAGLTPQPAVGSRPGSPTSDDFGRERGDQPSNTASEEVTPDLPVADAPPTAQTTGAAMTAVAEASTGAAPRAAAPATPGTSPPLLDVTQPGSMPPALADSVASAVRVGEDELRLVLNPPDLGQLDVRIIETRDGLRVSLHASTREASELIQQQLPALQTALESRDLRVERLEVRHDLGASLDQPGERGGRQRSPEPDQAPEWSSAASTNRASEGTPERGGSRRPGGRLDLVA